MAKRWRALIYTVPTTPSRTRAHVWREVRRAGALLLRDGVALLPDDVEATRWMTDTASRIVVGGGTATVITAAFAAADERRVIAAMREDRRREYGEIEESCRALLAHIRREQEHAAFSFEELEELEADLEKIHRWRRAVLARERFPTAARDRAARAIVRCERRIAAFARRASAAESRR